MLVKLLINRLIKKGQEKEQTLFTLIPVTPHSYIKNLTVRFVLCEQIFNFDYFLQQVSEHPKEQEQEQGQED